MPDTNQHKHASHSGKIVIFLLILVICGGWGIVTRIHAETRLAKETAEDAIPTVATMQAPRGPASEEVVLPGNVQAWHEAPIFARTSGYLKSWTTDIGAKVKTGDLLAEIETPEVDAQLHQAEADLKTAEANNQLAQSTAERWKVLLKTNAVSKQDADDKNGGAAAAAATMASAQANVDHLRELENFKHVVAPFDGVITARNTDTGALIDAGSSGTGPELFHIAETDKLRVYVQVPESDAQAVKPDLKADLYFAEYPGRTFPATLAHTADAIDPVTRTLLIQLEADNDSGELLPGSYAEVHLKLPATGNAVHLPVNTLLFRSAGMQVATIENGKAKLKNITIGRDYGREVEVIAGISPDETVVVNPPDSLTDGQEVRIAKPDQPKQDGDKKDDKKKDDGK